MSDKATAKMAIQAPGIFPGVPARLAGQEDYAPPLTRPQVDINGLAARAVNEVIDSLSAWQEQEKKRKKSFLSRSNPRPEIDLAVMAENLKEAVTEQYKVSAAQLRPPILELTPEHQEEVTVLQGQVVEAFCRETLRLVKGDPVLEQQIYEIYPALTPPPPPDTVTLKALQKQFDKGLKDVDESLHRLVNALSVLDELAESETKALAGTSMVTSRRLWLQAQVIRVELSRRLEAGDTSGRPFDIKGARW